MPDARTKSMAAFTRQAAAFAASPVLGRREELNLILDQAGIGGEDQVLDVGCGTGFLTLAAAARASRVMGVDLTPAMLGEAEGAGRAAGAANVSFHLGRADKLPFERNSFDVAMTRLTFHHLERPLAALLEMVRVVRPGGRVVVADIVADPDPAKAERHGCIERLRDPSHVSCLPVSGLAALFKAAGVVVVGGTRWSVPRRLDEWTAISGATPAVRAELETLFEQAVPGDAAGIGARRGDDGVFTFTHQWAVLVGRRK